MLMECISCNTKVVPKKSIANEWVIFWVVVFFPVAILYAITRKPEKCPNCGTKVVCNVNRSDGQDEISGLQEEISAESGKQLNLAEAEHKTRSFSRRDFKLAIVGESHYLPTLRKAKGSVKDYAGAGYINVILSREPDNPYDENAIKVMTTDLETIGYLSRAKAKRYQTAFNLWEDEGYVIKCQAKLIGGDKRKKNIGAWLDLATPKTIESAFHSRRTRK